MRQRHIIGNANGCQTHPLSEVEKEFRWVHHPVRNFRQSRVQRSQGRVAGLDIQVEDNGIRLRDQVSRRTHGI